MKKGSRNRKEIRRLVTSMIVGLATLNAMAQTMPGGPRLVVGIVVDQLRTDYIEALKQHFGNDGFRRLMEQGAYMKDVDFKVDGLDAVAATAMLQTGAYPMKTGVPAAMVYDQELARMFPALAKGANSGSLTNDSYTPEALRLSTLSDELLMASDGTSTAYALSTDPQQAVIMAGHAGTGAAWINNTTGNWASTSWYRPMPAAVNTRNLRSPLSARLDTMQWKPAVSASLLPGMSKQKALSPFRHSFSRKEKDAYIRFASSPLGNREVTDVAIEYLKGMQPSIGGMPDMLNLAYTLAPYKYAKEGEPKAELADAYIRLDRELARLFEAMDKVAGKGNSVIWLSSTGYYNDPSGDNPKYNIPTGEFSTRKAASLLNSYLAAQYGNGAYVKAFRHGKLWLDLAGVSLNGRRKEDVVNDARGFLSRMSGVAEVLTIDDILSGNTPKAERLKAGTDPKHAADLQVMFAPGWTVTEDMDYPAVSWPVREAAVMTPAFIIAPEVEAQIISTPVDATALAPTVAGILRIRSPNGSETKPLLLK